MKTKICMWAKIAHKNSEAHERGNFCTTFAPGHRCTKCDGKNPQCEQFTVVTPDAEKSELFARNKSLQSENKMLRKAVDGLMAELDNIESDEGITACQCNPRTPEMLTEPDPCAYCYAKHVISSIARSELEEEGNV